MTEKGAALKLKLTKSWEAMRERFPIVINKNAVRGDSVREDFLRYIDGSKSADDVRGYFTLDPSEAHLIFSDLLNAGAIRFLTDAERLPYVRQQHLELKKRLDFLIFEKARLKGETYYVSKQIQDREQSILTMKQKIPELESGAKEAHEKLIPLKEEANALWDSNSELRGLLKDMKEKESRIKGALDRLEYEYPKLMKRKLRMLSKVHNSSERVSMGKNNKERLEKQLLIYRDAIDDVREVLADTRDRINDFKMQ